MGERVSACEDREGCGVRRKRRLRRKRTVKMNVMTIST